MPDWTAPFHVPTLTTEEYEAQKAAYIARHGYTITIPGLSDIIKIRTEEPMTPLESYWWNHGQHERFSSRRLEEIGRQKAARRDRYLAMLASPTPAVMQNAGSIMTAIDDAQDAVSTLAAIGQLGKRIAPRLLGKLLRGPTGLLILTADLLNMVQQTAMFCIMPMDNKRESEKLGRGSPRMNKARLKNAFKTRGRLPTKGDWIQAAQTTEQIFGYGISLGPVVGLVQDIMFAFVRARRGVFVDVRYPIPDFSQWVQRAQRVLKSSTVLFAAPWLTDDDDILLWLAAASLSFQTIMPVSQVWNPLEKLDEIGSLELRAPVPWHTLTREVINEGPIPLGQTCGWPQTNQLWSTIDDLMDITHKNTVDNMAAFYSRNQHSMTGWFAGQVAQDASKYAIACLEGEDDVYYGYNAAFIGVTSMVAAGIYLDPDQPYAKFELFNTFLEDCEALNWTPTLANILEFCHSPWNDIKLLQQTVA